MPVKLLTSGGGGVNLVPSSSIASDQTMYLPTSGTSGGTVLCTDSTGGTANGVLYLNGSKQVTSGSGLVFDSSGNLGLGVTPSSWASIKAVEFGAVGNFFGGYSGSATAYMGANAYYNAGWKYAGTGLATKYQAAPNYHLWSVASSGAAGGAITWNDAMTLNSSGYLLVGMTGTSTSSYATMITNGGAYANGRWFGSGNSTFHQFFIDGTVVGSISGSGSTTTYATSSDYRLKEDIQPVATPIDRLNQLKPVNFAWKVDGSRCDGFLAHELQEVIPEAATGTKDETKIEEYEVTPAIKDEEGNVITEAVMGEREVPVYQGIDQSKIVPLLTAALQEAVAKIESQAQTIESLTQRIEALEYTKQGE